MNKQNAKNYIHLMLAWVEGKEIQHRSSVSGAWHDIVQTSFSDKPSNYRIKPEPRKVYVWFPAKDKDQNGFITALTEDVNQALDWVKTCGGHYVVVTE